MEAKSVGSIVPQLTYLNCDKGGYHEGEPLNIVCLAAGCNTALCCQSCVEEFHQ